MLKRVTKPSFCECLGLPGEIVAERGHVCETEKLIGRMISWDLKLQNSNVKLLDHVLIAAILFMMEVMVRDGSGPTT